jgi:triacylglycerol lipase
LAGLLLLRAVIIAISYAYARAYASPAPRLSLGQAVRMVLGEYLVFLINFVVISPCERWWMRKDRLQTIAGQAGQPGYRPPLLLVHGYGCSRAAWWWMRRRLQADGWRVATISLEPVYASIDDYVDPLARRIDAVLAETGADQLILVGHSMGGLVARAYLQRCGESRVRALLTLGTPHQGSQLARIGFGENARQMLPGSTWLRGVPKPAVDTCVIYSPHDNFVMPQSNLVLPGTPGLAIDGVGHLAMLYSPRVAAAVLTTLPQFANSSRRGSA